MKIAWKSLLVVLAFSSSVTMAAEPINDARAKFNYQMLCQGCHVGDGRGGKDIPDMRDQLGVFLSTQEGREYLIRVPGVANAALDAPELTELMNWLMLEFAGESLPDNFEYYTANEVAELVKDPLLEVIEYRKDLLKRIQSNKG